MSEIVTVITPNRLPRDIARAMVLDLSRGLPDPVEETPEARAQRDRAAIAEAAWLAPADPTELRVALRCVTADAWVNACLRLMNTHADDLPAMLRLSTQATAMGRIANANRILLDRLQARRRKATSEDPAEADREARMRAGQDLIRALEDLKEELAHPLPKAPLTAAHAPTHAARPRTLKAIRDAEWEQNVARRREQYEASLAAGEPNPEWLTEAWRLSLGLPLPPPPTPEEKHRDRVLDEADTYAVRYPMRSRLIRRLGNLPPDCGIDPPEPELLQAIRTGTGPNQIWADNLTPAQANLDAGKDRDILCPHEE